MNIALFTGQQLADVFKIKRTNIRDGALWIVQNKTGARLGIEVARSLRYRHASLLHKLDQA